jgi:hypothetical protein
MKTITNNIYAQVFALCKMDVNIAIIDDQYFTYLRFDASSSGNTSSIDFNTLYGICITEFIEQEKINMTTHPTLFYQQFEKFIMNLNPVLIKFNKTMPYFLFSK